MPELVGVREVLAVPGHQEVAPVVRGQCEVEGVPRGVRGHEPVPDVTGDDLGDGFGDLKDRQLGDQAQCEGSAGVVTLAQLVQDGVAVNSIPVQ